MSYYFTILEYDTRVVNISSERRGVAILVHHSGKRGVSKREDILDLVINLRNKAKSEKEEEEDDDIPF